MCDNRTMPEDVETITGRLAAHLRRAREEAHLTQEDLARAIPIDGSAVVKIENGTRRVSATELLAISRALDLPIDQLVNDAPPSVISRRSDPAAALQTPTMDRAVEQAARNVTFLLNREILVPADRTLLKLPANHDEACNAANRIREIIGEPTGPLSPLQDVAESLGLYAFVHKFGAEGGDASYNDLDQAGVAVINADVDAGRRRFNLAHEIGHHVFGDKYAPEVTINPASDDEKFIQSFAAHLLMPPQGILDDWRSEPDHRLAAMKLASSYRVSWSAVCAHLLNLDLVDHSGYRELIEVPPRKGEMMELGMYWVPELGTPCVPSGYARAVVSNYRVGKLTATRAVGLLAGTITEDDLPDRDEIPLRAVARDFNPLT